MTIKPIESLDDIDYLAEMREPSKSRQEDRIYRAAVALSAYTEHNRDVLETGFSDLLADLMHLADAISPETDFEGFEDALETAKRNYEAELHEVTTEGS